MATVTPDPPSPPAGLVELSPQVLFDYPDADVILRSRDSQMFGSSSFILSTVLLTQTQLPEVHLPVSSPVLSSLLTFIFPVNTILPSTLEETMELLSVAQKYEMSSVLSYIRGSLALQDPPFITPENAFLAYSLAQRYNKLAIMPGAYLHELWKYRQRVQAQLKLDLLTSDAGAALEGFSCSQYAVGTDIPYWIELYISSIKANPSHLILSSSKWPWRGIPQVAA
ncbi:hypothetical protein EDB87DRAFT_1743609 [Lactarius vividus]|nr:hypothetical protein EDB87DRAFT_1743609 [Lactarius vividus]